MVSRGWYSVVVFGCVLHKCVIAFSLQRRSDLVVGEESLRHQSDSINTVDFPPLLMVLHPIIGLASEKHTEWRAARPFSSTEG